MENLNTPLSDELLARYLAGTATAEEVEQVGEWIALSPQRSQELEAYRKLWEHSERIGKATLVVNTDRAWERLQRKIVAREEAPEPEESVTDVRPLPMVNYRKISYWVAALVILFVGVKWLHFSYSTKNQRIEVSTLSNSREHILPDGTKVYLNYNSSLSYPADFSGKIRSVLLHGEAFFEVAKDSLRPFVIEANGTQVRVLGTAFNVKAYSPMVRVDVTNGRVEVKKQDRIVELSKGQGVAIGKDSLFESYATDLNRIGYRTGIYDFTFTPLAEAVTMLNEGYHADIRLPDNRIADCPITVRFEKESLDITLSVIAETLDLTVKRVGNTYYLEGTHCH